MKKSKQKNIKFSEFSVQQFPESFPIKISPEN